MAAGPVVRRRRDRVKRREKPGDKHVHIHTAHRGTALGHRTCFYFGGARADRKKFMPPQKNGGAVGASGGRGGGRGSSRGNKPPSARNPKQGSGEYKELLGANKAKLNANEQKAVERAKGLGVPARLMLGITFDGLMKLFKPEDPAPDLYAVRDQMREASKADGLSMCERLQKQGSPDVGVANVYVAAHLGSSPMALLAALDNLIDSTPCTKTTTCFFIRDLSTRATTTRAGKDLERLKDVIASIGHTLLLLEKKDLVSQSAPLRCAYTIADLAYTAMARAPFDVMLSDPDEEVLHLQLCALLDVFAGVLRGPSARVVDSRRSSCRREAKYEDKDDLMVPREDGTLMSADGSLMMSERPTSLTSSRSSTRSGVGYTTVGGRHCWLPNEGTKHKEVLDATVGFLRVNNLVTELLSHALVSEARMALRRLPEAHRYASKLQYDLAMLLSERGSEEEATEMLKEAVRASREAKGEEAPETCVRRHGLALLLRRRGRPKEAAALLLQLLSASRTLLGDLHPDTLATMEQVESVGVELYSDGALGLASEAFRAGLEMHRKHLGVKHERTLASIFNLGMVLSQMGEGQGAEALALLAEAVHASSDALGPEHARTRRYAETLASMDPKAPLPIAPALTPPQLATEVDPTGA